MITKQTQNKVNELARVIADDYIQFGKVPEDLIEKYKHLKSELANLQVEDLKQNKSESKIRDQKLILITFYSESTSHYEYTLLSYNEFEKILSREMTFVPLPRKENRRYKYSYQYFHFLGNKSSICNYFNLFEEVGKLIEIEEGGETIELILAKKRLIDKLEAIDPIEVEDKLMELLEIVIKTLKEEDDKDEN